MSTIIELMLAINHRDAYIFYHKDTNSFDRCLVSAIQLQNIDENEKLPLKDENNFRFLSYDEIDHEEIMRFYVRECVEDKEIRKLLFDILRKRDFVKAFVEELRKLDLYEDFDMVCGDIYEQLFSEWEERNGLDFKA